MKAGLNVGSGNFERMLNLLDNIPQSFRSAFFDKFERSENILPEKLAIQSIIWIINKRVCF